MSFSQLTGIDPAAALSAYHYQYDGTHPNRITYALYAMTTLLILGRTSLEDPSIWLLWTWAAASIAFPSATRASLPASPGQAAPPLPARH